MTVMQIMQILRDNEVSPKEYEIDNLTLGPKDEVYYRLESNNGAYKVMTVERDREYRVKHYNSEAVSYTHLTLPTKA